MGPPTVPFSVRPPEGIPRRGVPVAAPTHTTVVARAVLPPRGPPLAASVAPAHTAPARRDGARRSAVDVETAVLVVGPEGGLAVPAPDAQRVVPKAAPTL